ncbi:MAG: hypothetical protein PF569_07955 [Candidatus Woesearchaeota archaeon]|jgi:hypothetical protein|nr:hypothetical protein [Candidatus Woesearchaeota archaeon]
MNNSTKKKSKILLLLSLSLIILLLLINLLFLYSNYKEITNQKVIYQDSNELQYTIIKGENEYKLIIGDLVGINPKSYNYVSDLSNFKEDSLILIPGFKSDLELNKNNFLDIISNKNQVIIADNFCTQNWEELKEKEIYKNTFLSPGSFCLSEVESQKIDFLIKKYQVEEVKLYYDSELYLEFINNFLVYLNESNLTYKLINVGELK